MAEKTEKATPKKLKDARRKGQIAKAQDMPAAMTFIVSITGALASLGYFYDNIASFLVNGPVFSFKAMKFDIKKLNPIERINPNFGVYIYAGHDRPNGFLY